MVILYTVEKQKYIDIKHLDTTKGISVYVNITNRCSCRCTFCLRQTKEMSESNTLWLKKEPTVSKVIEEFSKYDIQDFKEVVFCGFGEPLTRVEDVVAVASYLKSKRKDVPIRINTNGLSSKTHNKDITPMLQGIIDTVSVSLNAPTKEEYYVLTRSIHGEDSFDYMLDFTSKCKCYVPNIVMSVVDIIGVEKIEQCRNICKQLGVTLRVRPFEE